MGLYTLESPNTIPRLANQVVVTDTSHVFAVTSPTNKWTTIAEPFHKNALENDVTFIINVVVRQEFVKIVRQGLLVQRLTRLATEDATLRTAYEKELGVNAGAYRTDTMGISGPLSNAIRSNSEILFKWHVRNSDTAKLLEGSRFDIWAEAEQYLKDAYITYHSGNNSVSWQKLGELISRTGMAPTDAMIANFALSAGVAAIISMDCDYVQIADRLDVYLPRQQAEKCKDYDAARD